MPEIEISPSPVIAFSDLEVMENRGYEPSDDIRDKRQLEWTKFETSSSIPYYLIVSSDTRGYKPVTHTSWIHPDLSQLMDSFPEVGSRIKYVAYRTAFKLRSLQQLTHLSKLQLHSLYQSLSQHNYLSGSAPCFLSPSELEALLATAFSKSSFSGMEGSRTSLVSYSTEITLNFLLSCYDPGRTGAVSLSSVKTALTILSVAPLLDKYRYLFQLSTERQTQTLDRDGFTQLLANLMRITSFLEESLIFGDRAISPCYHSLLQQIGTQDSSRFKLSLTEFTQWALLEPESLVWIPTLHRLAAVESVKHSAKCGICRKSPIKGFNFRCQKCANLNICEKCFFSQRSTNTHKITHPMREYALPTTTKEDLKDVLRVVRNKLSVSHYHRSKSKQSYLRQSSSDLTQHAGAVLTAEDKVVHDNIRLLAARLREIEGEDGLVEEGVREGATVSLFSPQQGEDENRKLRERLDQLEQKNRHLQSLLDPTSVSYRDSTLEDSLKLPADAMKDPVQYGRMYLSLQQERMEVRVDVLEHHNRTLEEQLFNLRRTLALGENDTSLSPDTSSNSVKEHKLSEEEGLFALVSRILADPVTSKQRRMNPAVTEAVSSLGESLSSMVLELKLNSS